MDGGLVVLSFITTAITRLSKRKKKIHSPVSKYTREFDYDYFISHNSRWADLAVRIETILRKLGTKKNWN